MKSIDEYIKKGELPNIPVADYQRIGNSLGVDVKDLNQQISGEDFIKFRNDPEINKYLMQEEAQGIKDYYTDSYDSIKNATSEHKDNIVGKYGREANIMNNNIARMDNFENMYKRLFENRENTALIDDNMLNEYQKNRFERLNERIDKVDQKLKRKYQDQKLLKETLKNSRTRFKKARTQRRLDKINKRISKLQQKQGRLIGEQRRIAQVAAEKYKAIRNAQIEEYKNSLQASKNYVNAMNNLKEARANVAKDLKTTNKELSQGGLSKFKEIGLRFDKGVLMSRKNKLEKEIEKMRHLRDLQTRVNGLNKKTPIIGTEARLNSMTVRYA